MEHLNQTFFLWLNAPEHPNALVVTAPRVRIDVARIEL